MLLGKCEFREIWLVTVVFVLEVLMDFKRIREITESSY
jgi:hypothetical protein